MSKCHQKRLELNTIIQGG